jgi:hypothetical protein
MAPAKISNQTEHAGRFGIGHLSHHLAVASRNINLLSANPRQRQQCRYRQNEGDQKHRAAGQQIAGGTHQCRRRTVAERSEPGIAPEPLADRERTDQAEADRRDRRAQHAACQRMQGSGCGHDGKNRPHRIGKRAGADGRDRKAGHQPLGTGSVDDRSAGHLPEQGDDAADRQHKADLDLGPFLGGQIDRNERPEAGLHVGQKENEPVEAALAFARGRRRRAWPRRLEYERRNITGGGSLAAIVVNPIDGRGKTRDQIILP